MATKKAAAKRSAKKAGTKKTATKSKSALANSKSMPKAGKDPKGGLTQVGRAWFAKHGGGHLKPGVRGVADTPEKQRRKGSFLVRSFTHPRGPMVDAKGKPTRLALSAHAWGEPVPKTMAQAKKLAAKGQKLLERYQAGKKSAAKKTSARRTAKKRAA